MGTTSKEARHVDERLGLLGRKVGMMRIFTDDGDAIPVTVLDVSNNRVTQIKTAEADGYSALQVTFGERSTSKRSIRVGRGTGPRTTAPERLAVSTISSADWSISL